MDLLSLAFMVNAASPAQPPQMMPTTPVVAKRDLTAFSENPQTAAPAATLTAQPFASPPSMATERISTELACAERGMFESDHAFDNFINPVSNPVLSKDPRSSTWVRFLFVNNTFPSSHPFGGGNAQVYAAQANLALTDRLTFIADKDGYARISPKQAPRSNGWLDLAAGLKYTLVRDVEEQFLFAAGIMYEVPSGAAQVFQSQGSGIFTPFVSYGKQFCDHWHLMGTHGYSFAVDQSQNSSFFYHSIHLDREIGGWFYPLVEMNWFQYVKGGDVLPHVVGEGDGLLNLGTRGMSGHNFVTTAVGAKIKLTNFASAGCAYEFPLTTYKGILNNRITVDLVLRY